MICTTPKSGQVISFTLVISCTEVWWRVLSPRSQERRSNTSCGWYCHREIRRDEESLPLFVFFSKVSPSVHPVSDIEFWLDSGDTNWVTHTSTQVKYVTGKRQPRPR